MTGISQRTKAGQVSRIHRNGRTGVTGDLVRYD